MARRVTATGPIDGPWALPEDWRWDRIDNVAPVNPRRGPDHLADETEVAFVPMAAVQAETGVIDVSARRPVASVRQGFTRFGNGDVIFAKITPCMENGKIAVIPAIPAASGFGSTEFHVMSPRDVTSSYLYYWVSQRGFRETAEFNMTGTAGQKRVPTDFMRDALIPVPPADEQNAVVARIDELFAEIDDGEAALARARDDLATWRKALLKAAVTGELTADWRTANSAADTGADLFARIVDKRRLRGVAQRIEQDEKYCRTVDGTTGRSSLPEGWTWARIGDLFDVFVGATPSRTDNSLWNGDVPWVSSGEVGFCRISDTREKINRAALRGSAGRLHPPGTVMLGMIGEGKTRGQAAILDIEAAHNQNCASIRVSETSIPPEYIYLVLAEQYERTRRSSSGGNQPALNKERVKAICIPLPGATECRAIAAIYDEASEAIDAFEAGRVLISDSIATLRQSILAAAFRGELA